MFSHDTEGAKRRRLTRETKIKSRKPEAQELSDDSDNQNGFISANDRVNVGDALRIGLATPTQVACTHYKSKAARSRISTHHPGTVAWEELKMEGLGNTARSMAGVGTVDFSD